MVGDDTNLSPAGIEEGFDAFEQQRDLLVDSRCESALQRMAELVDLSVLGPCAIGSSSLSLREAVRVRPRTPSRDDTTGRSPLSPWEGGWG